MLGQRKAGELEVDRLGMCCILASPLLPRVPGAPPEAMAWALEGSKEGCACAGELDLGFIWHFSCKTDGLVALEETRKEGGVRVKTHTHTHRATCLKHVKSTANRKRMC